MRAWLPWAVVASLALGSLVSPSIARAQATPDHPPTTAENGEAGGVLAQMDREITALAEKARQSVVKITIFTRIDLPFRDEVPDEADASIVVPVIYSGVIVHADGYILTVADALDRATEFEVMLPDNRKVHAARWAVDHHTNLGILKITDEDVGTLTPVSWADSDRVQPGQFLLSCGNPFGLTRSISTGLVTGTNRTVVIDERPHFGIIQTNATINPGDPGGACFNAHGEAIGMIWSTFGRSRFGSSGRDLADRFNPGGSERPELDDMLRNWKKQVNDMFRQMAANSDGMFLSAQGINFILPSNTLKHVTAELIEHRRVRRVVLGVRLYCAEPRPNRPPVVLVFEVTENSAAAKAGLVRGDVVLTVNGEAVTQIADVQRVMRTAVPGQALTIEISRDGTPQTLTATLEADPDDNAPTDTEGSRDGNKDRNGPGN